VRGEFREVQRPREVVEIQKLSLRLFDEAEKLDQIGHHWGIIKKLEILIEEGILT
jgi:hypothetical protein